MRPELQLLVIDLGDCCVVKVEQGEIALEIGNGTWLCTKGQLVNSVQIFWRDFHAIRRAIDNAESSKPVPRIEVDDLDDYRVFVSATHVQSEPICRETYNALSQLAGNPLPVWSGGTWEEIKGGYVLGNSEVNSIVQLPCKIWRFTR